MIDAETGISLRFIRGYNADADQWPTYADVEAWGLTVTKYKLAECGCLTDASGFVVVMCSAHQYGIVNAELSSRDADAIPPHRHKWLPDAQGDLSFCRCGAVQTLEQAQSEDGSLVIDKDTKASAYQKGPA